MYASRFNGCQRFRNHGILLFLAVLGVVTVNPDVTLDASNPAADAFRLGAGVIGYKIFGLVLFFAATTSVIGAAYTSVSFLKTLHPFIMKNEKWFVIDLSQPPH